MNARRVIVLVASLWLVGCPKPPPSDARLHCESSSQCSSGTVCVEGLCTWLPTDGGEPVVREDGGAVDVEDAGERDAGAAPDGGLLDGGRTDAGLVDGGADGGVDGGVDAGVDAGGDGGAADAGTDAGADDAGCRECSCHGNLYEVTGADCTIYAVQPATYPCVPAAEACPACATSVAAVLPPPPCQEIKPGTCVGSVGPAYRAVADGTSCGAGCQCVAGARTEVDCSSGGPDEDGDGFANCADPDCLGQACAVDSTCRAPLPEGSGPVGCFLAEERDCRMASGDEDVDSLWNCADPDCDGKSCGDSCTCVGGAAVGEDCSILSLADEDGDGFMDCADPECTNQSCGIGCVCSGGVPRESDCTLGSGDEENDGFADCADFDCNNLTCGAGCRCAYPVATERNCAADSGDEDGDGQANCADTDCINQDCGVGSGGPTARCQADGQCHEVACTCNGVIDNDGDGKDDCDDPDCEGRLASSCANICAR